MVSEVQGGGEDMAMLMEQECAPEACPVSVDQEVERERLGLRQV